MKLKERTMYKNLLIATDGSEIASKAVSQGIDLAKTVGAKVTIVTVSESFAGAVPVEIAIAYPFDVYEKACEENAAKVLSQASAAAQAQGVSCEVVHVMQQAPAEGIIETAANRHCDLIIMGSHGYKGLKRFFLGSQAHRVVTGSPTSVLICR
jgi:nucleotide-binding universal stress UspA family protein